ncbi:MAG TPA: YIP1 family protein [Thermoanaerobaculia bacterium]|nr:YIP1 family protein [Thermoanaerobaculia bacterium]
MDLALVLLVWPLVAAAWMRKRGRSPAPFAAMLVPLAAGVAGSWLALYATLRGLAISGAAPHAAAAGIRDALLCIPVGGAFALASGVAALIRRHRAFVDGVVLFLLGVLVIEIACLLFVCATIASGRWQFSAVAAGGVTAAIAAAMAAWWTFVTGRGRVTARIVRFGIRAGENTRLPATYILPVDFLRILVKPAATMRRVLDTRGHRLVLPLVLAASVSAYLANRERVAQPLVVLLNLALLVGFFYLIAALTWAAGRFLGGTGSARDVRAALAWGLTPVIWAIVYRLPLAIWRPEVMIGFSDEGLHLASGAAGGCAVALVVAAAELAVLAWSLFVSTHTLAEAHRISWPLALASLGIVAVVPVIVVVAAFLTLLI